MAAPIVTSVVVSPGRRRGWAVVAVLVALMMVNFADKSALGLAAKPIIREFHLTLGQYGLVSSAFFLLFLVTSVGVSFAGDRLRTTVLIFVLVLLWGVAQYSMVLASGFGVVLVSRMLLGAAEGPMAPLAGHAAFKWLRDSDRSVASSLLNAGASAGVLVGTPVITYVITAHGWHAAFEVTGAASLVLAFVWLGVGKEGTLPASEQAKVPASGGAGRVSYARVLRTGTFLAAAFGSFAAYWSVAVGLSWSAIYAQDVIGLTLPQVAVLSVVSQLFLILVGYLAQGFAVKRMLDRGVSSRKARGLLAGVFMIAGGVAAAGVVVLPGTAAKLAMTVLSELAFVVIAIAMTVCGEIAPPHRRGGVLGTLTAIYALGGVIGPAVTGRLAGAFGTETGGLNAAWLVKAVLIIAAGVAVITWIRPDRDAARLSGTTGPANAAGPGPAKRGTGQAGSTPVP